MTEQISKLLVYQEADAAVDEAEKKLRSSKERKTANLMKQRYELAVEERKKLISQRDTMEADVAAAAQEIDRLTALTQADRVQNAPDDPDQLQKIIAELDKLISGLNKQEDKLKKINQTLAANEKKIAEYASAANTAKEEFNTNKAGYEALLNELKPEIDGLKAKRDALLGTVDKPLMERYLKLKANKISPTAPIRDKRCGGCHMEMPAFTLSKSAKQGYAECENCGRIVYVE